MRRESLLSVISLILNLQLLTAQLPKSYEAQNTQGTFEVSQFGELRYWSEETGTSGKNLDQKGLITIPQTSANEWNAGYFWNEERDINRIEIIYETKVSDKLLKEAKVQYWHQTWPGAAPRSHTIEDPVDDPWQGTWLNAETEFKTDGNKVTCLFKPLAREENKLAGNLPGLVEYRRTLKVRILYASKPPALTSFRVFSPTNEKNALLRIELGCDGPVGKIIKGKLEIFNGWINNIKGWNWDSYDKIMSKDSWKVQLSKKSKGIIADLRMAEPILPGSNDLTIVTVRSDNGTFSFMVNDLEHGPIYIPEFSAYISYASDTSLFSISKIIKGKTIREKLETEPEQTYDRAMREIPRLDVMFREDGGKLYLPLATDASWQKFGFEWGGAFFMNKRSTKAKGRELARCNWKGDELRWWIGTGKDPVYVRDDSVSHLSILNDYLPVAIADWKHEGLIFREEAFATLLEGPLSPYDPARDEQTPAVLMIKLKISNPANNDNIVHIWLKANSLENPVFRDMFILDQKENKAYIRTNIKLPGGISSSVAKMEQDILHISFTVPANLSLSMYFSVPFPGDLTENLMEKISTLDYNSERQRVISYWRDVVNDCKAFNVPERKFNELGSSIITHIRMSTTKDPKSGLYMVPAASFGYPVYANEAAFQTIFLDKIGDHKTAESYLETFMKLQGSVPMPGTYTDNQEAVFHGAKVDNEYNYTAYKYNLDHGTVLWALAHHYLVTRDSEWLKHASPYMLKAAEWIIEQRNNTKIRDKQGEPVLHYGLLPAGHLEDNADWGFWFAVNAYAWLGLHSTAQEFKIAGLPQADNLEKEANDYLSDLQSSVKRSSELSPVVRLRNNTYVPYVPSRVYQRFRYFGPMKEGYYARYGQNTQLTYRLSATREALYGPLILITTGVIKPFDPLADAILDDWEDNVTLSGSLGQHIHGVVDDEYWFSRGGMVFQPNLQNPVPAYLLRNEVPAAIRNIYNSMASCLYPDVNAFTEEYRRWGVGSGPMYKIPDEAKFLNRVCDMLVIESGKELWLAPGTPRYWLEPGNKIELYKAATTFGNVSYELRNGIIPNTIEASINLPSAGIPEKILLVVRTPFERPIKSVTINGKDWNNFDQKKEAVVLPADFKTMEVVVSY